MTTAMHRNGGKRTAVVKGKPRVPAPATPWRPRISRKSPALTADDQEDQPSPLDRKAVNTALHLKFGSKTEPIAASPAPTSATLVPGADKEESVGPQLVGDAYRRNVQEPGAPKLEQGVEWPGDRWSPMRSDFGISTGPLDEGQARIHAFQRGLPAFHFRPGSAADAYDASARRADDCLAFDLNHETNVYVNGLPKEMTDHMLYLLGSACGVVISHKAMLDRLTDQCKGFGFLMYASADMAKHAIEWLNSHGFAASFAKESFSAKLRRMADTSSTNVYLSNLPIKFTVQQLEQLFVPYPIASLKILYDIHGESRGVGFVRLYDRAAAKVCIERLHGRVLPGTTLPLRVRFADSDAQKHLKHSVSQKHTLESLGLLMLDARASGQPVQGLCRGELDAAVSAQPRNTGTMPRPFIPAATSLPVAEGGSPPVVEQGWQGHNGLGIQMPSQLMFAHPRVNQILHPAMWPSVATAGVVYTGMEGNFPIDRSYPMSPVVAGVYDSHKGSHGEPAGYLPIPLHPPPGLVHPSHLTNRGEQPHAIREEPKENRQAPAQDSSKFRPRHARSRNPGARVRFPGDTVDAGTRAVSDPMAMLAAQARVREALGLPDRVRAAVSADNSIDEGHVEAPADSSIISGSSSDDDEESFSVEIQIHPDARAA